MAVTRQDLHAVLYSALESGEWSPNDLHEEVNQVAEDWREDREEEDDGDTE